MGEEGAKPVGESTSSKLSSDPAVEVSVPVESAKAPSPPPPLAPQPSWFTPKRLLCVFCVINILNYLDRGAIASNGVNGKRRTCNKDGACTSGSGIQGDFNLNNFQDGVVSSAFMVGLLVASPIFASFAKRVNPFRLIGIGLSVWTIATAGCGFSINFWSITICRMFVGVGEASFISLAAPFIDDNAPAAQKTVWLGIFYMCIPSGVAFGYVYGGLVGSHLTWHWAFWIEAILMFPFAILGFVMKPLQLKGFSPAGSKRLTTSVAAGSRENVVSNGEGGSLPRSEFHETSKASGSSNQFVEFFKDLKALLVEKVFVVNVLGYIAYNFVIGAYSYWGPKAGYSIYHMGNADMVFGGITVVSGIVGTIVGGVVLDRMTSTLSNAFKVNAAVIYFYRVLLRFIFNFQSFFLGSSNAKNSTISSTNEVVVTAASLYRNIFWGDILLCCLLL
nr:probable sphingolipid transporter spinster homolog 2 [Ipomoea batatas]